MKCAGQVPSRARAVSLVVALALGCDRPAPAPSAGEVEAQALREQGDQHYDAGRWDQAATAYESALRLVPRRSVLAIELALSLAETRVNGQARFDEGCRLAEQSIDDLSGKGPGRTALEASAHYILGNCHVERAEFARGISSLEKARELHRSAGMKAAALRDTAALATALDYAGQNARAEALFREIVATREAQGAPAELARALTDLGVCLNIGERYHEALPILERARALHENGVSDDEGHAVVLEAIGIALLDQGLAHDALARFERGLELRTAALGPEHPRIAILLFNETAALVALGRPADALPQIDRALALRERSLPPDHPWLVQTRARRAEIVAAIAAR